MKNPILSLLILSGALTAAYSANYPAPSADFVLIKGGTFTMGSPASEDWRGQDEARHSVTVSDFYMSKFEVTQKQFREVTGTNPSHFSGDKLPVENVTWLEAVEFCNALSKREGRTPAYTVSADKKTVSWNRAANGYRLPTEAEWEYACRAGTATPFYTKKHPVRTALTFTDTIPTKSSKTIFTTKRSKPAPACTAQQP